MNAIIEMNRTNYDPAVLEAEIPVLVEFYAPDCEQCEAIEPLLARLSQKFAGRIKFLRVNVDAEPLLAARHLINAVPMLMLFKSGADVDDDADFITPGALDAELERVARNTGKAPALTVSR